MTGQKEHTIAILGLGYVGLPLAVAFSKKYNTLGFDINDAKASLIASGVDPTDELDGDELSLALQSHLQITADPTLLTSCNTFIITVPTDIHPDKSPNLEPLIAASTLVGEHLKKGDLVIYESTTYVRKKCACLF
jgi:UDP-N-acetyl-D-galactosamine dehydrogenase